MSIILYTWAKVEQYISLGYTHYHDTHTCMQTTLKELFQVGNERGGTAKPIPSFPSESMCTEKEISYSSSHICSIHIQISLAGPPDNAAVVIYCV